MGNKDLEYKDPNEPVTRGEFLHFLLNDFAHIWQAVTEIRGKVKVLTPLIIGVFVELGGIIAIIIILLKG